MARLPSGPPCLGVAFAVRFGLADWFPPGFPYLTFFPAVVLVAFYAGVRPAILTATLSGLTAWWFWIGPPGFDLGVATLVALGFYVFVAAVDIFFIVGMDSASRRLAREVERSAALADSRDILLREVQHRVSNNIQVVSALLSLEARSAVDRAPARPSPTPLPAPPSSPGSREAWLTRRGRPPPSSPWRAASSMMRSKRPPATMSP